MSTSSILKYLFISIFSLVINLPTIAVGAAGMGGDDDYDNVIGLITKSYTASTQDQVATITVTRTGTLGALTVDYSVGDNTGSRLSNGNGYFKLGRHRARRQNFYGAVVKHGYAGKNVCRDFKQFGR